jgi:hypothetical protein
LLQSLRRWFRHQPPAKSGRGGIAMRYGKLANTFLTGVLLVCVILWLN